MINELITCVIAYVIISNWLNHRIITQNSY